MNKIKLLLIIIICISFISQFFSFLALDDIAQDYKSQKNLISEKITKEMIKIPEWTNCQHEWNILRIDFIIRIALISVITVLILFPVKYNKKFNE